MPYERRRWRLATVVATAAYLVAGVLALELALPPGHASPLFPAAGIGLACVLVYGPRMLVAVFVAAALVNGARHDAVDSVHALLPLAAAVGATLQTACVAALIRRWVSQPLTLTAPSDVGRFFLACTVGSWISALFATSALAATGTLRGSELLLNGGVWWAGDLAGLLIATPITLTLIGRPRGEWASRRLSVGLTLTLVTASLALAVIQVGRWNAERFERGFEHDVNSAALVLRTRLQEPLHALESLQSVVNVSTALSEHAVELASRNWLRGGVLGAMGWAERVPGDEVATFEARARGEGNAGLRVYDRFADASLLSAGNAPARIPPVAQRSNGDMLPVRYAEPRGTRPQLLGLNVLSVKPAGDAVEAAIRSGMPIASAGFQLRSRRPGEQRVGVAVVQAVYAGNPTNEAEREDAFRGVAFVAVPVDTQLASIANELPPYLRVCVVDADAEGTPRRLAGPPGCETTPSATSRVKPLRFADRNWELHVSARPGALPVGFDRSAWAAALVGLVSATMLGASLLTVTGRARRIESAVSERTAALVNEVAERKVAEAALRESEQRFRNIVDNVPIGVVYSDLPGRVIQANPRFCEMTGYSEAELLGLEPHDYTHPEDIAEDVELTSRLVLGEIPMYRRQKRFVAKDGSLVWARTTVTLLRDALGQPWRIVGVVEDITEHLRLQEAERAREAAEASNRAKSDFLSRMSHELRTPLNAMLGFAQLLELDQRTPLAPGQRPWVAQIQSAGWHLLEMINDVLDLSRIESGNLRLKIVALEVEDLVASSVAMVSGDAEKRGIAITREFDPGRSRLLGDATRVKQILTNLLSNAVKYNVDGGRIHVAGRGAGGMVEVAISDSGLGMTPAQVGELFQPFNRLGREKTALQGTGIGLVISQRLAELMGGSIRAASAPGEGSSFVLALPGAAQSLLADSLEDALASASAEYHRRVVHYIEDNETNVEVMRGVLAQRPQIDMTVSTTGREGLAVVRATRPDLILLDMHLPDANGLDLLRELRADPATSTVPVVVVSADALTQQIADALAAGAAHYLTKPVNVGELLGVVDELLGAMETTFH
ncbi:PAS domain S-box protein [Piscinibacter koreensis]|uniref:histidine kinase n=1 Tax=Piscinibacter koreensis TaxID=2742824 RepID=A0A7Y6NPM3_9BURK|nr:PAS domain S-box protein [Schlegelella koreensis]NUZ07028.1 PAS domain S-box protein [Schlegelella koreensis]